MYLRREEEGWLKGCFGKAAEELSKLLDADGGPRAREKALLIDVSGLCSDLNLPLPLQSSAAFWMTKSRMTITASFPRASRRQPLMVSRRPAITATGSYFADRKPEDVDRTSERHMGPWYTVELHSFRQLLSSIRPHRGQRRWTTCIRLGNQARICLDHWADFLYQYRHLYKHTLVDISMIRYDLIVYLQGRILFRTIGRAR